MTQKQIRQLIKALEKLKEDTQEDHTESGLDMLTYLLWAEMEDPQQDE